VRAIARCDCAESIAKNPALLMPIKARRGNWEEDARDNSTLRST
jgi:hypothetical protein